MPYSNRSTDLGKRTDQGPSCHGGYPINVFPGGAIVTSKGPCPSVPPLPTPSGCVPFHGRPKGGRYIEMGVLPRGPRTPVEGWSLAAVPRTFTHRPSIDTLKEMERERTQINTRLCTQSSVFPILPLRLLLFFRLLLIYTISLNNFRIRVSITSRMIKQHD